LPFLGCGLVGFLPGNVYDERFAFLKESGRVGCRLIREDSKGLQERYASNRSMAPVLCALDGVRVSVFVFVEPEANNALFGAKQKMREFVVSEDVASYR
jgi:hypothetical protein